MAPPNPREAGADASTARDASSAYTARTPFNLADFEAALSAEEQTLVVGELSSTSTLRAGHYSGGRVKAWCLFIHTDASYSLTLSQQALDRRRLFPLLLSLV